jgi:hypothetical protein
MYLQTQSHSNQSSDLSCIKQAIAKERDSPEDREEHIDRKILGAADLEEDTDRRNDDRADQARDVATGHSHCCRVGGREIERGA